MLFRSRHYLGGNTNPAYTITYEYDDCFNMASRVNSFTGLEEYFTYANTSREEYPQHVLDIQGVRPSPYTNDTINAGVKNLMTGKISLWRRDGEVKAIRQEAREYYDDGSPKTSARWDAEYNQGQGRWIETTYICDTYGNITQTVEPLGKTTA